MGALSAQVVTEPGYTHSLVAVFPTAPSSANGAIAEHASGDLYLVGGTRKELFRMRPGEAGFTSIASTPGSDPWTLAIDGDIVYIAEGKNVHAFDISAPAPQATFVVQATDPILSLAVTQSPYGLAIASDGGADFFSFATMSLVQVASQGEFAAAIPVLGTGFLAADRPLDQLVTFAPPAAGSAPYFSPTAPGPDGLARHPFTGDIYIACSAGSGATDVIQKLDPATATISDFVTGLNLHSDRHSTPLAFSSDGSRLYFGAVEFGVFVIRAIDGFPTDDGQLQVTLDPALDGSNQNGSVSIGFDAESLAGRPVSASFDYSLDGGLTFQPCSGDPCSPVSNPSGPLGSAAFGSRFIWNSLADTIGFSAPQPVELRLTLSDGTRTVLGSASFAVSNHVWNSLAEVLCGTWSTGDVDVTYDGGSADGLPLVTTMEFSVDGGTSFQLCTPAASSPTSNPSAPIPTPMLGTRFIWNSLADTIGLVSPNDDVLLRLTTTDGVVTIERTVSTAIDNTPGAISCAFCGDCDGNGAMANILDSFCSAQIAVEILAPSPSQRNCCDTNVSGTVDVIDSLRLAQSAAGVPAMLSCP